MKRELVDLAALHAAFTALVMLALLVPIGSLGGRIALAVLAYDVALPLIGRARGHRAWAEAWRFLMPLSILQIAPDWFLSEVLGTLRFADTGFVRVGGHVPLFMGGMWLVPLFLSVRLGELTGSRTRGAIVAATVGTVVFVASEALVWRVPVWEAVGVAQIAHVALYVAPAELALSLAAFHANDAVRQRSMPVVLSAALAVMLLYAGALAIGYLLVER